MSMRVKIRENQIPNNNKRKKLKKKKLSIY